MYLKLSSLLILFFATSAGQLPGLHNSSDLTVQDIDEMMATASRRLDCGKPSVWSESFFLVERKRPIEIPFEIPCKEDLKKIKPNSLTVTINAEAHNHPKAIENQKKLIRMANSGQTQVLLEGVAEQDAVGVRRFSKNVDQSLTEKASWESSAATF